MALVAVPGGFLCYPPAIGWSGGTLVGGWTLDADDEEIWFVMESPVAADIDELVFGVQSITANGDIVASVQTVDPATGLRTGTLWDTNTDATVAISSVGLKTATLTAPASMARGDVFAVVLKAANSLNAYVESAPGSFLASGGISVPRQYRPYQGTTFGGSPSKQTGMPNIGVHFDGLGFLNLGNIILTGAFGNNVTVNFNSGSASNEYALKFTPPWNCRVNGVQITSDLFSDPEIRLYDASNNVLAGPITPDKEEQEFTSNGSPGVMMLAFDVDVDLTAGADYRLAIKATQASPDNFLHVIPFQNVAHMDTIAGGQTCILSHRSGGAWTDVPTTKPKIFMQISAFEASGGAGGGGGLRPVGVGGLVG